jgi:hypothetical protein
VKEEKIRIRVTKTNHLTDRYNLPVGSLGTLYIAMPYGMGRVFGFDCLDCVFPVIDGCWPDWIEEVEKEL